MFVLARNISPNNILICDYSEEKIMPYEWYFEDRQRKLKLKYDVFKKLESDIIDNSELYEPALDLEQQEEDYIDEMKTNKIDAIIESIEETVGL